MICSAKEHTLVQPKNTEETFSITWFSKREEKTFLQRLFFFNFQFTKAGKRPRAKIEMLSSQSLIPLPREQRASGTYKWTMLGISNFFWLNLISFLHINSSLSLFQSPSSKIPLSNILRGNGKRKASWLHAQWFAAANFINFGFDSEKLGWFTVLVQAVGI